MALSYEASGKGIPLVLIHAFPFCSEMWKAQVKFLERKVKVITVDLPGFGASPYEVKTSMAKMAKQIAALLDSLKVKEPAVICGLSMGGYVAFEFYRQFPKRVKALGLFSTRAGADTAEARTKRLNTAEEIRKFGMKSFNDAIVPKLVGKTTLASRRDLMRKIKHLIFANSRDGVRAALTAMAERKSSTDLLASIQCPVLIIAGQEDELISPAESEKMHKKITGSDLYLIEQAGHLVNIEQPAAFKKAFDAFLLKHL